MTYLHDVEVRFQEWWETTGVHMHLRGPRYTLAKAAWGAAGRFQTSPRPPLGDAGDAIDYALGHIPDQTEAMTFLDKWREGDVNEWPEYFTWLERQYRTSPSSPSHAYVREGDTQDGDTHTNTTEWTCSGRPEPALHEWVVLKHDGVGDANDLFQCKNCNAYYDCRGVLHV